MGASGSGKSSVVRAGLLHQLKLGQKLSGSDSWKIYIFRPGRHPLKSLAQAYINPELSEIEYASQLKKAEELIGLGAEGLKRLVAAAKSRVVLLVDQFEEVFTVCEDSAERELFFKCLLGGLTPLRTAEAQRAQREEEENERGLGLCVIMTMRADFLGKCAEREYAGLAKKIQENLITVTPMTAKELEQAITEPAKQVGLEVERELVTQMLADVEGSPGSLPLLQYTLTELWQRRTMNRLVLSTYNQLGGLKGTLQKRADEIYEAFSDEEKLAAKRIFLELTQLGEGTEDTRRQVRIADLVNAEKSSASVQQTIQKLANAKLIVTSSLTAKGSNSEQVAVVDVAHEALIRHWPLLRQWVQENRDALRKKRNIETSAQEWLDKGKPGELAYLLQGPKLAEAEIFIIEYNNTVTLSSLAQEFVEVSERERDRLRREKEATKRRTILGLVVGLIFVSGAAIWAESQRQVADYREKTARSLQLATASETSLNIDSTRSILLAIQANIIQETPQAAIALWKAFQENHEQYQLVGYEDKILYGEFDSRDSKRLLTVSSDRTARIWNLDNLAQPLVLRGHLDTVVRGSFDLTNPNRILTVSYDGTARIWNLDNSGDTLILKGHKSPINYGSFDPYNPQRVLTVSSDGTARVWNLNDPNNPIILEGHEGDIWSGSFDLQNPNRLLTVSRDSTARVWDLNQPNRPLLILRGHTGDVLYGCFDPKNSNRVLTVSSDRTARVWDLNNLTKTLILRGHQGIIKTASFAPANSNRVLTVSADGTARVWDLSQPDIPVVLRGHKGEVTHGSFNPENSEQVLTVSADGTAKIWDLKNPAEPFLTLYGHHGKINWATFDPKNTKRILTISDDKTARIWDIRDITYLSISVEDGKLEHRVLKGIFDPKNPKVIFTIGRDGTVKSWNFDKPSEQKSLPINLGKIKNAFFAPNNPDIIATIGSDGGAYVWNIKQPNKAVNELRLKEEIRNIIFDNKDLNRVLLISGNKATVWNRYNQTSIQLSASSSVMSYGEFDPNDSNRVATASADGIVRIWSLKEPSTPLSKLSASKQEIWQVSFDPKNSNRILTMGSDRVARVWDIASGKILTELIGHEDAVVYGSFDPNNSNRVLTVSYDGTSRVWDLRTPNNPIILKGQNQKLIYGSFDSQNSNQVITIAADGKAQIYTIGGKELLQLAWYSSSRCFTEQEIVDYNLSNREPLQSLANYLHKSAQFLSQLKYRPYCQQGTVNKNEQKSDYSTASSH